jgi:hypothetical protein
MALEACGFGLSKERISYKEIGLEVRAEKGMPLTVTTRQVEIPV